MNTLKLEADGASGRRIVIAPMGDLVTSSSSAAPVIPDSAQSQSWQRLEFKLDVSRSRSTAQIRIIPNTHFQWTRYLTEMTMRGKLSLAVMEAARELWDFILERAPAAQVPHAGPTENGGLQMVWDNERHHLEFEVSPSGRYDWFYRDRETDRYTGAEDSAIGNYSPELREKVRLLWPERQKTTTTRAIA